MLKYGEVNPLNVAGLRELEHCPPHFTRVPFTMIVGAKGIKDWIYENLEGRFWLGNDYTRGDRGLHMNACAGFEIASEASYFVLMLDQFNRHKQDW